MKHESNFTPDQIRKVNQVVLGLMKNRRIFLADEHNLNLNTFSECVNFDKTLRDLYKNQQALTKQLIEKEEETLGVTPPILKDGQSIVTCSLYTGGLEISGVYPIQQFLGFMPKSYDELYTNMFTIHHGEIDDIPPRQLPKKKEEVKTLTDYVWAQLQAMKNKVDGIVLVMQTRFYLDNNKEFEILKGKIGSLMPHPEGLAYLFYLHELKNRIVKHNFVLFNCERSHHSRVTHWSGSACSELPDLDFYSSGGYDCKVKLACFI